MMTSTALAMQFWNRDELYEDVWNQPLAALVPKYGVSAVAIGKTCRRPIPWWRITRNCGHDIRREGERIQFGITERTRQVRVPDPTATPDTAGRQRFVSHYEATGELSVHAFSSSSYFTTIWRDTEQTKIESLVPECIASMMKVAVEYRRATAKRHQEEFFRKLRWEELQQPKTQVEAEDYHQLTTASRSEENPARLFS